MPFLRIKNKSYSTPSIELLRTLGSSSSRGHDDRAGQFGSGWLYSLAVCARQRSIIPSKTHPNTKNPENPYNEVPYWLDSKDKNEVFRYMLDCDNQRYRYFYKEDGIYYTVGTLLDTLKQTINKDVYTFSTESVETTDAFGDAHTIDKIIMRKQNGGRYHLNISTEWGAIDWDSVTMALREFITNALDNAADADYTIDIVDDNQNRAAEGYVITYVYTNGIDDEVYNYYLNRSKYFRQLGAGYDASVRVIRKATPGPARFYRKGVFTGEFGEDALFDYEVPDLELDESRNVAEYEARTKAAKSIMFADAGIASEYLRGCLSGRDLFEKTLHVRHLKTNSYYNIPDDRIAAIKAVWKAAARQTFGNKVLCESSRIAGIVESKGFDAVSPGSEVLDLLKSYDVRTADDVLNKDDLDGREIIDPTPTVINTLDKIWGILESKSFNSGKDKPPVRCFHQSLDRAEGSMYGFYRDGVVYINTDIANDNGLLLANTMLEEVAHYVTGAADCTREFQSFLCRLAAALIMDDTAPATPESEPIRETHPAVRG